MSGSPSQYRREAELVEQLARQISLRADKQELLAQAHSLRLYADEIEAQLAVTDIEPICSASA